MKNTEENPYDDPGIIGKIWSIDGWLAHQEIIGLYNFTKDALKKFGNDKFLVEIGSFLGRSTVTIGLACKESNKGKLLAIDPHQKGYAHVAFHIKDSLPHLINNLKKNGLSPFVKIERSTSEEAFKKYRNISSALIYIDGNHSYDFVKKDFLLWNKTLCDDGYLMIHDSINLTGPRQVMLEIMRNTHYIYIRHWGELACFQKRRNLTIRNWFKKMYGLFAFWIFFKIYEPV